METYVEKVLLELIIWQQKMTSKPSLPNRLTKGLQKKINNIIPKKIHDVITTAIKNMVKAVLIGSEYISNQPLHFKQESLEAREKLVLEKRNFYKKAAAVSGASTGAGGLLLGLAELSAGIP